MFGDKLVTAPYGEAEQELPSPNQLRYKIILKNKKIESQLQSHQQKTGTVEEDDYDSDFEEEMMEDDDEDEDSENSVMTMEEYLKSMHGR